MIEHFQLPFHFDADRLKAELQILTPEDWVPHFNKPYYEGEWSGVALRSVDGVAGRLYPDPTAQHAFADTPILTRLPYMREVMDTMQCTKEAVRLLKLRAGSSIREHKDYNLGFEDGEIRIHVPIMTDPRVEFYVNGERIVMDEGGWTLTPGAQARGAPVPTPDRLQTAISLLQECGRIAASE